MNSLFALLGIGSWKPVVAALLLPPVPLLLLVLIGARLIRPRRGLGWFVVVVGVALLWLTACVGASRLVTQFVLQPPPALSFGRIAELKAEVQARHPLAIVVLGGGIEPYAPEYGVSNLRRTSLERLRYGIWLGRATGAPLAFSGGVGYGQRDTDPEAEVAAKIAANEFGRPLKWTESDSRDTRENAARTVALLRQSGIRHVVLVTHGWHMPRALRAFSDVAGSGMRVEAAPMGMARGGDSTALLWIPSTEGYARMRNVLHELIGLAAGS